MKKHFYYIFALLLAVNVAGTFAQEAAKPAEEKPKVRYKLIGKYPLNIANVYKMTEKVDVKRTLPDGNVKKYSRELTYYFTLVAPNAPVKGFVTLLGTVDSLIYKFKDDAGEISYNSQDEEAWPPLKYQDYEQSSVLLGKDFEMTYSPYGEITEFGGESLFEKRASLADPRTGPQDSLRKFIWLNALGNDMLEFYFDVQKNVLPDVAASADTTWKAPFYWQTEGYRLIDTVDVTFEKATSREFVIKGTATNLRGIRAMMHPYLVPLAVEPESGEGVGSYTLTLNPQGGVLRGVGDFNINGSYKLKNDIVKEEIRSNVEWELLDMYRW